MFPLTTEDLAKAADRTVNTILHWHRIGLFEGIESTKTGGKGQGVRRCWPETARARVHEILRLKSQGYDTTMMLKHFQKQQ
jgi:DNA-binding transcriptional MerR regulator